MDNVETTNAYPNRVRVLFSDHAAAFSLANGATMSDLIDRLDDAGGWGSGSLMAAFLQFGTSHQHQTWSL